jgi:hemoglobin/transferrin/lactoferrin receptor protein
MKRKSGIFVLALCLANAVQAQIETNVNDSTSTQLTDITVFANKFPEKISRVAQFVSLIKKPYVLHLLPNTADVLVNSGQVYVQKSQQGGGSPVLRGFEGSRLLLMVDGVRMNTAIFRTGHLQNILTVDNMVLDKMEVFYGPSSTIFGSDALGGVVSMYTIDPRLNDTGKTKMSGSATARYATANNEKRVNTIINIGGKHWASLTSITYGEFGDILQGNNRRDEYPDFGKKYTIVKRFNDQDSIITNPNPNEQVGSGYEQTDIIQKILYRPKENIQHIINVQISNTSNIPRYDRLTDTSGGKPIFAEWYYGPAIRNMGAYHFNASKLPGFFQYIKVTASYQDVRESRITRRLYSDNKDYRWERVDGFGINADFKHYHKKNELHLGADSYTNFVRSTAERRNISSGISSRIATRYADGPTRMSWNAVYAQQTYKISERFTLNDGLRLNHVLLDAVFVDTAIMKFPFTRAKQKNIAITGNIGLIYNSEKGTRIAALISSGFRSPNVDDLSKVFDTKTGSVVVPNPGIKPEYTYNFEINFNHHGARCTLGGSVFNTIFRNAIVVDAFQLNGMDSIIYDGVFSGVLAAQNKARAFIFGFSFNASWTMSKKTIIDGVFTYTKGDYTNAGQTTPLDHIPPIYGRYGIRHTEKKWQAEFFSIYNGWKRIKDYSLSGEDNLQYATKDGMPAWMTFNMRIALTLTKTMSIQLLAENLTDLNYRYFSSGISAAGRNFAISLRAGF